MAVLNDKSYNYVKGEIMRFSPSLLGRVDISPAAQAVIDESTIPLGELLNKHTTGDWGSIGPDDRATNVSNITDGEGTVLSIHDYNFESILILTRMSPFKNERYTEIVTGFEI